MTITHTTPNEVIQAMQKRMDKQQATIDRLRAELEAERTTTERLRAALRDIHRHVRHEQSEAVPDEFWVVD